MGKYSSDCSHATSCNSFPPLHHHRQEQFRKLLLNSNCFKLNSIQLKQKQPTTFNQFIYRDQTPSQHLMNPQYSRDNFAGYLLKTRGNKIIRVNGIQLHNRGHHCWDSICKDIQATEADLVGLAETNIDDTKFEVNQMLHSVLKKHFQHYSVATSSSSIQVASVFKAGSTLNLVHEDLVGCISLKCSH